MIHTIAVARPAAWWRVVSSACLLAACLASGAAVADSQSLAARFPSLLDNGQINQAVIEGVDLSNLVLSEDARLTAYFIGEDTAYRNTVGWYDASQDPTRNANRELIWANASELGSGGQLKIGNPVNLGKFTAGTQLGVYLTVDGGASTNGNSKKGGDTGTLTYFSDQSLNPDGVSHVMAGVIRDEGLLVLGFNDLYGGQGGFGSVTFVIDIGVVNAARLVAGAPEPGEWALLLVGTLTLGVLLYRRREAIAATLGGTGLRPRT